MGAADTVTKVYMKENTVFADAFNYLLYRGRAVVDPAQLQELDTTEIALPFGAQDEDGKPQEDAVQKYRDVLKSAVIKEDGEAAYILLGIENQTDIHYAMPVRNAVYDALQYGRQVADIAKKHRREDASSKAHSRGEYLSGFYKDDRLTPVITLVLHFGANEWNGPLSLHEMMNVKIESSCASCRTIRSISSTRQDSARRNWQNSQRACGRSWDISNIPKIKRSCRSF